MLRFQFRDAFINAFDQAPANFLWSDDGVLRTSAMQSYIYPAIAAYMKLYLVCELPADASFLRQAEVQIQLDEQRGYPRNPVILLEHENNARRSVHEMDQLARQAASLNVLITYWQGTVSQQLAWTNKTFSEILSGIVNSSRAFLVVLPGKEPEADPQVIHSSSSRKTKYAGWFNFFEWGGADFRRLEVTEAPPPA